MDFLISYTQEKIERKSNNCSKCELKLFKDENNLIYVGNFDTEYKRYGEKKQIRFEHKLTINLNNGDIIVSYNLINNTFNPEIFFRNSSKKTKNNFKSLENLCDSGFIRGEKRKNYWGVKYTEVTNKIFKNIYNILSKKIDFDYFKNKEYQNKFYINPLYDLILDFHLDKKKIKGHDNIYFDIQTDYPKKKWLLKNDNKYLPAVLDSYGIKSKYLIGELSKKRDIKLNIASINYLCKLFGENYVEYFKSGSWKQHCFNLPINKKTHTLLNDNEKKCVLTLMMKDSDNRPLSESILYSFNKLFSIRDMLTPLGYDLKFNARNEVDLEILLETWSSYKNYHNRGYKWMYNVDLDFKCMIERDVIISNEIYKPKLLTTEEDFRFEGLIMKNCMSKQFSNGALYLFISLENKNKRVNLQYRKGNLIQSYGKANTTTPEKFSKAIEELTIRIKTNPHITWTKQKYDIIK